MWWRAPREKLAAWLEKRKREGGGGGILCNGNKKGGDECPSSG